MDWHEIWVGVATNTKISLQTHFTLSFLAIIVKGEKPHLLRGLVALIMHSVRGRSQYARVRAYSLLVCAKYKLRWPGFVR